MRKRADMSEEERERVRARERAKYQRKRARLLTDPAAMQRFQAKARERVRRFRARHAARIAAERRTRANQRYSEDAAYRTKLLLKQRRYVEENRALVYQRNREYYERLREQIATQRKARRQANLDEIRARNGSAIARTTTRTPRPSVDTTVSGERGIRRRPAYTSASPTTSDAPPRAQRIGHATSGSRSSRVMAAAATTAVGPARWRPITARH